MRKDTLKKISFLSIVVMIVGTSVGSGIFMKNNEILRDSHQNILLAVGAWVIAGIGCLAMGVALIELTSATYKNNRGILGWTKVFTKPLISNSSKNFVAYVSMPFVKFLLPVYFVQEMQKAFGWKIEWWAIFLLAIAITLWFSLFAGYFTRLGVIQNWVITIIKAIPIVGIIIWGFASVNLDYIHIDLISNGDKFDEMWKSSPTSAFSPIFGLLASIPAVYFAIDGFYSGISVTSEMKNPQKAPLAVIIGIFTIIVIYLLISVAFLVSSSDGAITGIPSLSAACNGVIIVVVSVLIGIGILGIENAYCMMVPRLYEELIKSDELPFCKRLKRLLNPNRPIVGVYVSLIILLPYFIVFTIIGSFVFYNMSGYDQSYFTASDRGLYSFTDLIGNWSSFFIFLWITVAIWGGIVNRKTNRVATKRNKYFLPAAYITIILNVIALLYIVISTFVDLGIFINNPIYYNDGVNPNWMGGMLKVIMLFVMILLSFGPETKSIIKIMKSKRSMPA